MGTPPEEAFSHGEVTRLPTWIESGRHTVAVWVHTPADARVRPNGVLLCPSFGFEYAHAHRTFIHLADALAEEGFAVMRLDYPGGGNSSGSEDDPELVAAWLAAVDAASATIEAMTGGPASIVGLRLGGLLAGVTASKRPVHGLVAWAPIVRGRRYVRELRTISSVADAPDADDGHLEAGGFRVSDQTADELRKLDLTKLTLGASHALVIDRVDQPSARSLVDHLSTKDVTLESFDQDDYMEMMAEPHYTKVPNGVVERIIGWLAGVTPDERNDRRAALPDRRSATFPVTPQVGDEIDVIESLRLLPRPDGPPLFGVLCEPASPTGLPIVLLPNSGSVHHVGPNRLYVELARTLASEGVPSLRFDLRNLGDSRIGPMADENHPYPDTAVADIGHATAYAKEHHGYDSCIVAGLCSGAHAAFHAGGELDLEGLAGAVCINPLTYRFEPGLSLETPTSHQTLRDAKYYENALRDPARWKRLLRRESDLTRLAGFLVRRTVHQARRMVGDTLRAAGALPPTSLDAALDRFRERGRTVHFVFSSTDPGHELLLDGARHTVRRLSKRGILSRDFVPGADHTFSRKHDREAAIRSVCAHVGLFQAPTETRIESGPRLREQMAGPWRELLDRTGLASAFMASTWIDAWLEAYGGALSTEGRLWHDRDGKLVAASLLSRVATRRGPVRISRGHVNASGALALGCEHNDLLSLPRYRMAVTRSIRERLLEMGIDEFALYGVRSSLFSTFMALSPTPRWSGYRSESPYVDLDKVREADGDYLSFLSSNTRSQIRRSIRMYEERNGPADLRVADCEADALEWFDEMLHFHDERWDGADVESGFTQEARDFHASLIRRVHREPGGDLGIDVVRVAFGDFVVGILYHLTHRGHLFFYQSGFAYESDSKLKPGLVCHTLSVNHSLDRGDRTYDFLGGEVEPVRYKRSLSTDVVPLYWAGVPSAGLRSHVLTGARKARRVVRRLRKRFADR